MEYTFLYLSTLIIMLAAIYQHLSLYQNINKTTILNKERINIQLSGILDNQANIIPFYGLTWTTILIFTLYTYFYHNHNYFFFLPLISFQLVSFIIEYHFFLLNVGTTANKYNVSIDDELTVRENFLIRTNLEKTNEKFSFENLDIIQQIFLNLNKKYSIEELERMIDKQKAFLKRYGLDRFDSVIIRTPEMDIFEFTDEGDVNLITLTPSIAFSHFYKEINLSKALTKSFFEGIVVSFLLILTAMTKG